jgi:hypothetical protein
MSVYVNPLDNLFRDTRSINDMPFGAGAPDREAEAQWVRATLATCDVHVAEDIELLGCTGAYAVLQHDMPEGALTGDPVLTTLGAIKRLRLGLAGGGVGLPCFVPIDRFCLAHNTIGGLEPGQAQRHADQVNAISRELTPEEKGKIAVIELARKKGRKDPIAASDILAGRDESVLEDAAPIAEPIAAPKHTAVWKCQEHTNTDWKCRYCIAQAIVDGPLAPVLFVDDGEDAIASGNTVEESIAAFDAGGKSRTCVNVRVATFTRKLSRD